MSAKAVNEDQSSNGGVEDACALFAPQGPTAASALAVAALLRANEGYQEACESDSQSPVERQ